MRAAATAAICSVLHRDRSVPFGKYCRSSPFVFSFVGRCQGECGRWSGRGAPRAQEVQRAHRVTGLQPLGDDAFTDVVREQVGPGACGDDTSDAVEGNRAVRAAVLSGSGPDACELLIDPAGCSLVMGHRLWGKPRSMAAWLESSQRVVITLPRVKNWMPSVPCASASPHSERIGTVTPPMPTSVSF